ncbi:alkaline phosphatase D family protein [Kitasatospora sp. NPDC059327]|uniref:alkaline phosphatase D family protein n=1 Tax=Kitasatospora sp. NPDC059327 TaxID=3346803 RepID=UPI0036D02AB9
MDVSSNTLSDHIHSEISRRRAVQLLGVGAAAVAAGSAMTGTAAAAVDPLPSSGLVAAVLEYADGWTNAVGLRTLLEHAGFTVIDLDPTKAATAQAQAVDLIAFGSFTNNGPHYTTYVKNYGASLQEFTKAGGVVLDLAQSDRPGEGVAYMSTGNWRYGTTGLYAVRTDADFSTIYPVDTTHPLVSALLPADASGRVFTGRATGIPVSWESLGAWKEMRVLLACAPGTTSPAALLEGRDSIVAPDGNSSVAGKGRYLVSSLTIDKCYTTAGVAIQSAAAIDDSRRFFNALTGYVQKVKTGKAPTVRPTLLSQVGPLVGHVSETTARLWARPGLDPVAYPTWKFVVKAGGVVVTTVTASISTDNDNTLLADVTGLQANTAYTYTVTPVAAGAALVPMAGKFTTSPVAGTPAKVTLGMGSCAHNVPNYLWTRVMTEGCEGFVMLGDTPYADNDNHPALPGAPASGLEVVRAFHREFLGVPELGNMVRSMPVWGVWDDHDFGGNNGFGNTVLNKDIFRRAFVDYNANATFGHTTGGTQQLTGRGTGEGVYSSFRRGPIEIFLIDPRWFSDPSSNPKVCMGAVQKEWLFNALSASTATFKVLASGMTWYRKVGGETDHWATFQAEKDEVFNYINQKKIRGCVLLSGDIHVSRALNNGNTRVGYDLWEYVVSPVHRITAGDVHTDTPPELKYSKAEPYTFLKLVADTTVTPARLTATWINRDGQTVFEVDRPATDLGYPA